MQKATEIFAQNNLSYIDCWIYGVSQDSGIELKTQDKKLSMLVTDVEKDL